MVSKKTVTAIFMLYKNMKTIVCSPNDDTNFFDIVTGVLEGDTLESFLLIIYLDDILWMSIDLMMLYKDIKAHLMVTLNSLTLSMESRKEIY